MNCNSRVWLVVLTLMFLPWRGVAEDPTSSASSIKSDENIVFFQTAAYRSSNGRQWRIPIHGWIYEPEDEDPLRYKILKSAREEMGVTTNKKSLDIFERRIR